MPLFRLAVVLSVLGMLAACSTAGLPPERYLAQYGAATPTPDSFRVCMNFGCRDSRSIRLEPVDWDGVRALFDDTPADAAAERARIALAVARMETLAGARAGFFADKGANDWPRRSSSQLDCIDETVNTSVYLTLMLEAGLLRFHRLRHPQSRFFPRFSPHNTAVLVEVASGQAYAVDSWFHDNGLEPEIVTIEEWEAGYRPVSRSAAR